MHNETRPVPARYTISDFFSSLLELSPARLRRLRMHMTTSIRQVGGVTIVDISGRIVLGEESGALRELVRDLLSKEHKKVLLNLGNVNYIDSSGLGCLVIAFKILRRQQGELKLLNLTIKLPHLIQITKLPTLFT